MMEKRGGGGGGGRNCFGGVGGGGGEGGGGGGGGGGGVNRSMIIWHLEVKEVCQKQRSGCKREGTNRGTTVSDLCDAEKRMTLTPLFVPVINSPPYLFLPSLL